jgi:dextranase
MMDINRESQWHNHIIKEFQKAVKLGFDGIHMDQYGFPKEACTKASDKPKVRHLRNDFPELIEDTRKYMEKNGEEVDLIFNAVNNWPIDTVANTPQDCVYIEVWSPNDTFEDLNRLILNAKRYAPQKQVILAAYLKGFLNKQEVEQREAENGALLTMATIFSSGGFHLLLGEKHGVLTEAYYPTYATIISQEFKAKIRSYYDFIVRYEELLYSLDIVDNTLLFTGGINEEYVFKGTEFSPKAVPGKVWTQVKEKNGAKIIQLVNFTEVENMNWVEGKTELPATVNNIEVTALIVEAVKGVFLASPDFGMGNSIELKYTVVKHGQGNAIQFIVPELRVWDMVYILVDTN